MREKMINKLDFFKIIIIKKFVLQKAVYNHNEIPFHIPKDDGNLKRWILAHVNENVGT